MRDPYEDKMRRLQDAILRSRGALDPSIRQALALAGDVPEALAPYAEKVARYAYKLTDDDVRALLAAGYSEDQIFEATVSAALGAALVRLTAGLDALRRAEERGEG